MNKNVDEVMYIEKSQLGKKIKLPNKKEVKIVILNRSIKLSGGKHGKV